MIARLQNASIACESPPAVPQPTTSLEAPIECGGSAHHAVVAALLLRLIERTVGALVDSRRSIAGPKVGQACRHRDADRIPVMAKLRAFDDGAQLVGHSRRRFERRHR